MAYLEIENLQKSFQETEVLKVTYGFVAVECEAGENEIVFDYSTPGLVVSTTVSAMGKDFTLPGGVWISLVAFALYLLYMAYYKLIKKHKAETKFFSFDFYDDCGAGFDPAYQPKTLVAVRPVQIDDSPVTDNCDESSFEDNCNEVASDEPENDFAENELNDDCSDESIEE